MTKIVYNACYGGFSVSEDFLNRYAELVGKPVEECHVYEDFNRADPILIQVIEELGFEKASGCYAKLRFRELKPGTLYRIEEYDGYESVVTADEQIWSIA